MSSRQTAREFLASRGTDVVTPIVKLPDFRKIEGFDFFRNVLYIDGLEFEIPAEDVLAMKRYAVDIALDHVVKQLAEALIVFGVPPALAQATADSVKESAANAQATTEGSGTTADAGTERLLEGHHETASGAPSDGVSRSD
jgi:hypothetical protein